MIVGDGNTLGGIYRRAGGALYLCKRKKRAGKVVEMVMGMGWEFVGSGGGAVVGRGRDDGRVAGGAEKTAALVEADRLRWCWRGRRCAVLSLEPQSFLVSLNPTPRPETSSGFYHAPCISIMYNSCRSSVGLT